MLSDAGGVAAGGLRTTGTVQTNAYKEVPVFPIAGGIVREVTRGARRSGETRTEARYDLQHRAGRRAGLVHENAG